MGPSGRQTVEDELRERLRGVRLVLEIGLDDETIAEVREKVRSIAAIAADPESALGAYAPATLATFLVALGVESYDGSLWPHLGIPRLEQNKLGRAFEEAIRELHLETFDDLGADHGYRYITPIVAHGGIPRHSARDYLGLVIAELRRHPGASADELVAFWRARRTVFANIDSPVRRFLLYGGGVAVDFLDRTIDLVQMPPADATPTLAGTLGLPRHIVEAYATLPAGRADRTSGAVAATRAPRPSVRFDPWSGSGPVAELPALGVRYRGASWRVVDGDHARFFDASLMEATLVPLDPAATWEVEFADGGSLTREYAYECLGVSPVVCFDPTTGLYVPDTHPIALDDVWVLMPRDTRLMAIASDGSRVAPVLLAELPTPSGRWSGFVARHIRLVGIRALHAQLDTVGSERPSEATIRVMRAADRPALVGERVADVVGELGEAVYAEPPRLLVPSVAGFDESRWTITVKGPGVSFQGSVHDLARDGGVFRLPLATVVHAGSFDLAVRGPLGTDLRERFVVVSGIRVATPERVLLPDDGVRRTVEVQVSPGVLVDGVAGQGARLIPIPREGTTLPVTATVSEETVLLQIQLPRLQWGLRHRDAMPLLQSSRLSIRREDLESGHAEALVVATHRAGIPLALQLWADDGPRQSTPTATASPRDGRWSFDLAQFRETVRMEHDPRLRFRLQVGAESVPVADLTANVGATDFVATSGDDEAAGGVTVIEFMQARVMRSRVARLWSLDRPWAPAIEIPIPDDGPARFLAAAPEVPAGRYRAEIAVDDGWSSARRPRQGAQSTGEVVVGTPAEVADRRRSLRWDDPSDTLERAILSGVRTVPRGVPGSARVVELALDGALAALADPEGSNAGTAPLLAGIAFSDPGALASLFADRFAGELADRETLLRLLLLALPGRPHLDPSQVDARAVRALWQACPPMAALVDIPVARREQGDADDRCDQHLGWRTAEKPGTRAGLSLVEVGLAAAQLRALRVGLALVPRGHMTMDAWVLASIEWLLVQRETSEVAGWWRRYGWIAQSGFRDAVHLDEPVRARAPVPHPDKWIAFPQATLAAALHLVRGDDDRVSSAAALDAAIRIGAGRLVVHDLCLARALVEDADEIVSTEERSDDAEPETQRVPSIGSIVHGTVIRCVDAGAFVDIGLGVDAFVPYGELADGGSAGHPDIGTVVEAMVVATEPTSGKVRVSPRALIARGDIASLAFGGRVTGTVVAHRTGGCFVDLGFIDAFLPDSELSAALVTRPAIGSMMDVFVLSADPDRGSVRVTTRDLDAEAEVFGTFSEGQRVRGRVAEVTDIGAFVDLGGVVGLLYTSHIPRDARGMPLVDLEPGQEIEADVLHVRPARGQIGLSMRYLESARFQAALESIRPGTVLDVTVTGVAPFGVFVDAVGVRGLVHRQELSWDRDVSVESFAVGTDLRAMVVAVDEERSRVSLSFRRLTEDPHAETVARLIAGTAVDGIVTGITNFGAFVRLSSALDALLHVSELPDPLGDDDVPQTFIARHVTEGMAIRARIVAADPDTRRISLTLRRPHPWLDDVGLPSPGDVVAGTVTKGTKHGLFVELEGRLLGVIGPDALGLQDVEPDAVAQAMVDQIPVGSHVEASVTTLDREARLVRLMLVGAVPPQPSRSVELA